MTSHFNTIKRSKPLLGTYVSVELAADLDTNTLMDISNKVFIEIEQIQQSMSFHDPESELSFINSEAAICPCLISADLSAVLETAIHLSAVTDGRYDISIAPELIRGGLLPDSGQLVHDAASWRDIHLDNNLIQFDKPLLIDLGGIAKGYAVDKAYMAVCDQVDNLVINAGGDLRVKHWQEESVGIKSPDLNRHQLVTVTMAESAIATTAAYYHGNGQQSIIDPDTREPLDDPRSISVFAPSCMLADALTKVVLLAENAGEVLQTLHASALIIDQTGTLRIDHNGSISTLQ